MHTNQLIPCIPMPISTVCPPPSSCQRNITTTSSRHKQLCFITSNNKSTTGWTQCWFHLLLKHLNSVRMMGEDQCPAIQSNVASHAIWPTRTNQEQSPGDKSIVCRSLIQCHYHRYVGIWSIFEVGKYITPCVVELSTSPMAGTIYYPIMLFRATS